MSLLSRLQHYVRLRCISGERRSTRESKRTEQHSQIIRISHIRADPSIRFRPLARFAINHYNSAFMLKIAGGNPIAERTAQTADAATYGMSPVQTEHMRRRSLGHWALLWLVRSSPAYTVGTGAFRLWSTVRSIR